jgi:tripartite-type tricarboxylate transporter receptor subunit TctC
MALLAGGGIALTGLAPAQGWKPERNVELTIPSGPGGSNDIAGRIIQKIWTDRARLRTVRAAGMSLPTPTYSSTAVTRIFWASCRPRS